MTHIVVVYFRDGSITTIWQSSLANARAKANTMLDLASVSRVVVARIQNDIDKDEL